MAYKGCVTVLCFLSLFIRCHGCKDGLLNQLLELVEKEQITENRPFRSIGQWQEIEGTYKNYVMFNFRGGLIQATARHEIRVLATNCFISSYVVMQLLDAQRFGKAPMVSKTQIERTVRMLGRFNDRNGQDSSLVSFFIQRYNQRDDIWCSDPQNIIKAFDSSLDETLPFSTSSILIGSAPLPNDFGAAFTLGTLAYNFGIPPDFDTTFVNFGLGGLLHEARESYPEAWQMWADNNPNIESVFDAAKKYAYRPFSDDPNMNSIDPRTYYAIRYYLDQAKRDGRDLALLSTYAQSIDEQRVQYSQGVLMGCGVNNIDSGLHANFMSGMIIAFSTGLVDADLLSNDPDLELIVNSTASLLLFDLQTNFTDRPDLALLYYPSVMQFYWFMSRSLLYMEVKRSTGPLPEKVFETFYRDLKSVMTTKTTEAILESKQVDPSGGVFYDDFIGTADISPDTRPLNRAEDRVYTTAMAANALIYIWSVYDESQQKLMWRDSVPDRVTSVVKCCAHWLERNTLNGEYLLLNSFFSVDMKGRDTMLYAYPANRFEYMNGSPIDDVTQLRAEPTVYAMEGYVEPEEYERLLGKNMFGFQTPLTFHGYNEGQGNTVMWSSVALTYGATMMAVSMTDVLEER